jgi:carboxypeptidase D
MTLFLFLLISIRLIINTQIFFCDFQVHCGIHGFITDSVSGEGIEDASVKVAGINKTLTSASYGDYWRLLVPGTYSITVEAAG